MFVCAAICDRVEEEGLHLWHNETKVRDDAKMDAGTRLVMAKNKAQANQKARQNVTVARRLILALISCEVFTCGFE